MVSKRFALPWPNCFTIINSGEKILCGIFFHFLFFMEGVQGESYETENERVGCI